MASTSNTAEADNVVSGQRDWETEWTLASGQDKAILTTQSSALTHVHLFIFVIFQNTTVKSELLLQVIMKRPSISA